MGDIMNAIGCGPCSFGRAYCTSATGVPGEGQLLRRKMRCKVGSPTRPLFRRKMERGRLLLPLGLRPTCQARCSTRAEEGGFI